MPVERPRSPTRRVARIAVAGCVLLAALGPLAAGRAAEGAGPPHLLVSEVMTGGASASDEFVELYNASASALPLEGLELVYVTATGATLSRKAAWAAGAPHVPPGAHVLIANELGIFAGIADALYAGGLAASGGSMALRIQGASTAIDAVGWGTAASSWIEGAAAPAPAAGSGLERLPGGALGSTQDTDDNAADFVERAPPDPQNSTSPAVPATSPTPSASISTSPSPEVSADPTPSGTAAAPSPTPSPAPSLTPEPGPSGTGTPLPIATPSPAVTPVPTPNPTATPTPIPTPIPTPTPTPSASVDPSPSPQAPIPIAVARGLADGSAVTISGVALTDSIFTDGGGYIADATGGIAVLLSDGSFQRGAHVTVAGVVDDRFAQRTLRADANGLRIDGTAADPVPVSRTSGSVDESLEGRLVTTSGAIMASPTTLTGGVAFEIDDGSGALRVLVGTSTGISTAAWQRGARVELVGVLGQRDSSGTGASGYRIQPRDGSDIVAVTPPAPSPTPNPSPTTAPSRSPTPRPSPSPAPSAGAGAGSSSSPAERANVATIAEARASEAGTRLRVTGVVTLASGTVDPDTAVVQDATGGIVLRTSDEAGSLSRGELVEVEGTRSTLSGMQTLRVSGAPTRLGTQAEPPPVVRTTGMIAEADEALLVTARGAIASSPRRTTAGNVSLTVDDGSGPASVFIFAATGISSERLVRGAWIEVSGVVGQETSGSEPDSGYRIWPRDAADVRLLASPTGPTATGAATASGAGARRTPADTATPDGAASGLAALLPGSSVEPGPDGVRATLVAGRWQELSLAGVLWDGTRAVGIADEAEAVRQISAVVTRGGPPAAVRLSTPGVAASLDDPLLPVVRVGPDGVLERVTAALADPLTELPDTEGAAWVRLTGRLSREASAISLAVADGRVQLDERCDRSDAAGAPAAGDMVVAEGLADGSTRRLVIGCGAIHAAPVLAAGGSTVTVAADRAAAAPASAPSSTEALNLPALLLLGASAAAAGIAGVAAWRRGTVERLLAGLTAVGPRDGVSEPAAIEPVPDPGDDATRRLELVSLPGERGQPPGR